LFFRKRSTETTSTPVTEFDGSGERKSSLHKALGVEPPELSGDEYARELEVNRTHIYEKPVEGA
jgi:hypothetical protein